MLNDFVIASEADLPAILASDDLVRDFGGEDLKGIDLHRLENLYRALKADKLRWPWTALAKMRGRWPLSAHAPVAQGPEDGPWIFRVPEGLVRELATLPDGALPALALTWKEAVHLSAPWPGEEHLFETLSILRELATRAVSERRSVFTRVAL